MEDCAKGCSEEDSIKVLNETMCKQAANTMENVIYAIAKGKGSDLPHGCIQDEIDKPKIYIYWNNGGSNETRSCDPNIKVVCSEQFGNLLYMLSKW